MTDLGQKLKAAQTVLDQKNQDLKAARAANPNPATKVTQLKSEKQNLQGQKTAAGNGYAKAKKEVETHSAKLPSLQKKILKTIQGGKSSYKQASKAKEESNCVPYLVEAKRRLGVARRRIVLSEKCLAGSVDLAKWRDVVSKYLNLSAKLKCKGKILSEHRVEVPLVADRTKSFREARGILRRKGLRGSGVEGAPAKDQSKVGLVYRQSRSPATKVPPGTIIRLHYWTAPVVVEEAEEETLPDPDGANPLVTGADPLPDTDDVGVGEADPVTLGHGSSEEFPTDESADMKGEAESGSEDDSMEGKELSKAPEVDSDIFAIDPEEAFREPEERSFGAPLPPTELGGEAGWGDGETKDVEADPTAALVSLIEQADSTCDYSGAISLLDQLQQHDPLNAGVPAKLAELQSKQQRAERQRGLLERALGEMKKGENALAVTYLSDARFNPTPCAQAAIEDLYQRAAAATREDVSRDELAKLQEARHRERDDQLAAMQARRQRTSGNANRWGSLEQGLAGLLGELNRPRPRSENADETLARIYGRKTASSGASSSTGKSSPGTRESGGPTPVAGSARWCWTQFEGTNSKAQSYWIMENSFSTPEAQGTVYQLIWSPSRSAPQGSRGRMHGPFRDYNAAQSSLKRLCPNPSPIGVNVLR